MGAGIYPYQKRDCHFIDGKKEISQRLGDFISKIMK